MSRRVVPAAVLALLLPSVAWAGGTVAIPPLVPKGVDPKVSKNITGLLSSELDFSGAFDTVNEMEAAPASLNATCLTQTTCLAAIAKGAGADSLVVGSVGPGPDGLQIFLVLYDAGKNTVVRKQTFNVAADPASLTENSGKWIKQLTTGQSPAAQAAASPSAASFEASDEEDEFEFDKGAKPKTRMDTSSKPRALEDEGEDEAPAPKSSSKAKADADAKAKAEAQAKAEADAKAKAEAQAKAKAEAERKAREEEVRRREEEARLARAKAEREREEALAAANEAERQRRDQEARQAELDAERRAEEAKQAKIEAQRRAEDERRAREAEEERQARAAAAKPSSSSKSKPAPAEDEELEFGSSADSMELDFGSNAGGITFDEGGGEEDEAPAPKPSSSSKSTASKSSGSSSKSSASSSRPTYEDDELDEPAPKKPTSYEDDEEDVLADEDEPAPRKSYDDLDEEDEPRPKSSSSSSKSSASKSGSSSSKSSASKSSSSSKSSSGSSKSSSSKSSSSKSGGSKSSMRYEDLDKGSKRSSPDEKPGVSVAGRVGYSRYGNFNFVTYGAELGIPVAPVVSLVVGIEGFSTQRHLSDAVVAKLAQEADVSEDEIDPDPWNTILPVNFGVVYKSNGETVKPYGGVDLTLTPYTADFDIAFGARARGGADFMVADNFGLNLNVAVGFMSGSKLEQTESGVNNSGLIPQISAGTVFAF